MNELKRAFESYDIVHLQGKDKQYQWYTCFESPAIPNNYHCVDGFFDDCYALKHLDENKIVTIKTCKFMPRSLQELILLRKYPHYTIHNSKDFLRKVTM